MSHTHEEIHPCFFLKNKKNVLQNTATLREVVHTKSGATILHIHADDKENFFCISFKTTPFSSNGVAHALEHIVLCGSEQFPVKDPFFAMNRRSLNTFMNAFTGSDFTCYPAASILKKDFYNLLTVYLDSVFHSTLSKTSFLQEAHRLTFTDINNPKSSLKRTGVVFNEMKGAYANPLKRLDEAMDRCLFAGTTYAYDSGGSPSEIPTLTYEELVQFHTTFYHPTHALFFFYGDIEINEHLSFLENTLLHSYEKAPPLPQITNSYEPFAKRETVFYPIEASCSDDNKSFISFGFITTSVRNQLEVLSLIIMDSMLFGTDGSPAKHALLQSGLCQNSMTNLEPTIAYIPYTITAVGVHPENTEAIETFLFSTLETIGKEGFSRESIERALHEVELSLSEIDSQEGPFGLSLYFRSVLLYHHGVDIDSSLDFHALFDEIREILEKNPAYFTQILNRFICNNPHKTVITCHPSKTIAKEEKKREETVLKDILQKMTPDEKTSIIQQTTDLLAAQEKEQNINCLPNLTIKDVSPTAPHISFVESSMSTYAMFAAPCFTNGLCYLDILTPLPKIDLEELWLAKLFLYLVPNVGNGNKSFVDQLLYQQAYTGGISSFLTLHTQANDYTQITPSWTIQGKCLDRNISFFCSALSAMITNARFDETERIHQLIQQLLTSLELSLPSKALSYALLESKQHLSMYHFLSNQIHGLPFIRKLKQLVSNYDSKEKIFLEKMNFFTNVFQFTSSTDFVLSASEATVHTLHREDFFGLASLPPSSQTPWEIPHILHEDTKSTGYTIASQVNHTAMSFKTCSYTHIDSAPLSVAAHVMNDTVLHTSLREKGGAYGGGAKASPTKGTFSFHSFKDPNIFSTIQTYEMCCAYIQEKLFSEENLFEAKLGVFQALDAPIAKGDRAITGYFWKKQGLTQEIRQHWRDAVFATTKEQIAQCVKKYCTSVWKNTPFIAFGSDHALTHECSLLAQQDQTFCIKDPI